jgi:N-acetylmuramoyl-L-alanine amidase
VAAVPPPRGDWVVAIDAGHGGQDNGASYHGAKEKDIALALAREVQAELDKRPGIQAFLVRKGDYYIPLRRRWTLAEKQGADLFVSIHCNASRDQKGKGTEVFFLSLKGASDEQARELAEFENSVDEKMGVEVAGDDLNGILQDMVQADVLAKSQMLAEICLDNLYELGTVYNRGVKQAGFGMLKSPRMPSVLVEAAFISNKDENKLLRDPRWQRAFGRELADGIVAYTQSVGASEKVELH